MLLDAIAGIDDVPVAEPRVIVEPDHLLGRVLQIVVHGDDVGAARVTQPGHDRVVLAEIARVLDVGDRAPRHVAAGRWQTSPELSGLPSLTSTISSPPAGCSADSASTSRPIVAAPR